MSFHFGQEMVKSGTASSLLRLVAAEISSSGLNRNPMLIDGRKMTGENAVARTLERPPALYSP